MKVYQTWQNNKQMPQIKISNNMVREAGFEVGDCYSVHYNKNQIIITKGEKMKLLTEELIKEFEKQGYTDGKPADTVKIIAKFFDPIGKATWYAVEWLPEDGVFFGFVSLFNDPSCDELGYFSLKELESYSGPLGLGIERDLYFGEHFLSEVLDGKRP